MASDLKALADDLAALKLAAARETLAGPIGSEAIGPEGRKLLAWTYENADRLAAALRTKATADGRVEALIREARDRAFRQELAEATLKSEREKWLRAAQIAMKGNPAALIRMVERARNPVPIQGSGALPSKEAGTC